MRHDKLLDAIMDDIEPKASEASGEATPGITLNDLNAMAEKLSATVDKKISEALEKASAAATIQDKKGTMIENLTTEHDNEENESEE